jgi:hypothetical protein
LKVIFIIIIITKVHVLIYERVLNTEFARPWTKPRLAKRLVMILPQVHLRKPCYDFYFL